MKHGFNKLPALTKRIAKLAGKRINIGVFNDQAEKAIIHTYGTDTIPARPFLAPALAQNEQNYAKALADIAEQAIKASVNEGKDPDYHIFDDLRATVTNDVKNFIETNQVQPPDSAETIKRKGSNVTLVDEGKLVNSITTRLK